MAALEWNDSFSIGVLKVDQHNQHLFELLSSLHKGLTEHSDARIIKHGFEDLSDYIIYHFACEEIWMVRSKFSLVTEHSEQHNRLRLMFFDTYNQFKHGNISGAIAISSLIKLVIAHIEKCDTSYGCFANGKLSTKNNDQKASCQAT
jgi:hemerythrin-like metal-binding protein